jgi:hypothetical protein
VLEVLRRVTVVTPISWKGWKAVSKSGRPRHFPAATRRGFAAAVIEVEVNVEFVAFRPEVRFHIGFGAEDALLFPAPQGDALEVRL